MLNNGMFNKSSHFRTAFTKSRCNVLRQIVTPQESYQCCKTYQESFVTEVVSKNPDPVMALTIPSKGSERRQALKMVTN